MNENRCMYNKFFKYEYLVGEVSENTVVTPVAVYSVEVLQVMLVFHRGESVQVFHVFQELAALTSKL